nr:type IV pilin protein [uncultured Albidiferax sp.]
MNHVPLPKAPRLNKGFTLIELMITVAVIGILSAIALPAYNEQIARGRRTEAQTVLIAASQWMERFYTENYSYSANSAGTAVTDSTQFPARFSTSPVPGQGTAMYTIGVVATATTYTITATRKTGGSMSTDRCGDMTVDNLGRRSVVNYNGQAGASKAAAITYCWK